MNVASCSRAFSGLTTKPSMRRLEVLAQRRPHSNSRSASWTIRRSRATMPRLRLLRSSACEVESVHVQLFTVDDHHLAVIARQVVGRARHGDAGIQHPQLELAQPLVAAGVGVGNQRPTATPRLTAASIAFSTGFRSNRKMTISSVVLARSMAARMGLNPSVWLYDEFQCVCLLIQLSHGGLPLPARPVKSDSKVLAVLGCPEATATPALLALLAALLLSTGCTGLSQSCGHSRPQVERRPRRPTLPRRRSASTLPNAQ